MNTMLLLKQARLASIGEYATGSAHVGGVRCDFYPRSRRWAWFDKTGPITRAKADKLLSDRFGNDQKVNMRLWRAELLRSAAEYADKHEMHVIANIRASISDELCWGRLYGWRINQLHDCVELLFEWTASGDPPLYLGEPRTHVYQPGEVP